MPEPRSRFGLQRLVAAATEFVFPKQRERSILLVLRHPRKSPATICIRSRLLLFRDYPELAIDGELIPVDGDVSNFAAGVVEQRHGTRMIEVPSVTRRSFSAIWIDEGARPRAGYAFDRHGGTSVDDRLEYRNVKVRVRLEYHREKLPRHFVVERLGVFRLIDLNVPGKQREYLGDVVTVPRIGPATRHVLMRNWRFEGRCAKGSRGEAEDHRAQKPPNHLRHPVRAARPKGKVRRHR